jgi:hypothetical protein
MTTLNVILCDALHMSWSQQWQCLLSSLLHGSKALVAQNRVTISSEEKKKGKCDLRFKTV